VHRDIKPANMMLTANGVIKLMDFGIAKSGADRKADHDGTTMGSLYYMSPEQIRGVQTLDPRSDLYSVGVSLYELVTGQRPFEGESQFSIMSAHLEKDPKPPIAIDPSLPSALNEIILTAVQREPERRFQSAEAFRKALLSIAPAAAVAAPPPARPAAKPQASPAPAAAAPKSRRALWLTVGAVTAVAAIVAVVEFAPFKRADAGAPLGSCGPSGATGLCCAAPEVPQTPLSPAAAVPTAPAWGPHRRLGCL
jgi:serine/threonine-protein kinase